MPAFGLTLVGAYVVIVAATGIFWSLQCLAIRLFIRLRIHGPLSWDDYCCAIATVLAVTQSSLAILGTRYGLGHRQDTLQTATVNRQRLLGWINNQFYLATLCFSMLSVCFLIVRVTKRTEQVRLAYAIAILTVLWAVISMPTVALDCAVPHPWIISPRSRYTNIYHVWLGVTIAKAVLEIANVLAAIKLLWSVRIPWRAKAAVLAAFTIRLLVIPPTLTRLRYIHKTLHAQDWSYSRIRVVMITQVVLHVSVILATVPCAKPWLVAFEGGGLQAPAEARKESTAPRRNNPHPSPLLPITHPPAAVTPRPSPPLQMVSYPGTRPKNTLTRNISWDSTILASGAAGHRKRVEAWPLKTFKSEATYSVKARYVPRKTQNAGRKGSRGSRASSQGIMRSKSFTVQHADIEDYFNSKESDSTPSQEQQSEHAASSVRLEDVGGLFDDSGTGSTQKAGGKDVMVDRT